MQIAEPASGGPTHSASAPVSSCALRAGVVVQPNVFLNERQNALWLSKPSAAEISQIEVVVSRTSDQACCNRSLAEYANGVSSNTTLWTRIRTEELRVGKEWVRTRRSRWTWYDEKTKQAIKQATDIDRNTHTTKSDT